MRIIDYEELRKLFDEEYKSIRQLIEKGETHLDNLAEGFVGADRVIWNLPDVDVAEVRHGTWKEHDRYVCNSDDKPVAKIGVVFICSECGRQEYQKEPYCHCGAKMDGKEKDNAE